MLGKVEPVSQETTAEASSAARVASPALYAEDLALVRKLTAGDEAAFARLVRRHHPALIAVARRFLGNTGAAEEVVQETWLGVLRGLPGFRGCCALRTWIFRILTNRAKTRLSTERRSVPLPSLGGPEGGEIDPDTVASFTRNGDWRHPPAPWRGAPSPEDLLLRSEIRSLLAHAIEDLPPLQQAVVRLRDVEGWTAAEVCNVLEVRETNQRVLLHRGRSSVRRALARYFGGG